MDNLFAGKNGFIWWFGVVEENNDDLGVGRCKVRIHGWHNPDDTEIPTNDLPWAVVITSINNAAIGGIGTTPVGPQPGTRVFGFFLDGEIGQQPVILGTLPGDAVTSTIRSINEGSTPQQPSILDYLPNSIFTREGDCPDGYQTDTSSKTSVIPSNIKINKSEWTLPCTGFVSSAYGETQRRSHRGVDICPAGFFKQTSPGASHLGGILRGPTGIPVYAAAEGKVVYIWSKNEGQRGSGTTYDKNRQGSRSFGNAIAIQHNLSTGLFVTIYAHLGENQDPNIDSPQSGILVSVGDTVRGGQQIGTIGRTHVWDSLTHLHFEIRTGTGLPKSPNHINPGIVFPQLAQRHSSYRSWVDGQNIYNVTPIFNPAKAPVIAKGRPL